jgi:hypothetical protein
MSLIIPPTVATYATNAPYITVQEFLDAPTGVDTAQLIPNGGSLANSQTLRNLISRASAWADSLCNQKLGATLDTQAGQYRVRSDGTLRVPLDFTPIIAVSQIQTGWSPSTLGVLTATQNVWIGANVVTVPVSAASAAALDYRASGLLPDSMYCTIQYVNGWADDTLTAAAAIGATSVTVSSALGFMPGQTLTLYGTNGGEAVTVDPSFVPTVTPGATSVPLSAPLVNAYNAGDTLTAMPQAIKQAVIALTCVLIKTRGAEGMVMQSIHNQPSVTTKMEDDANDDFMVAADLLAPFKRVM